MNMKPVVAVDDQRIMPFPAIHCRTVENAIDLLNYLDRVEELWLDHDLGGKSTIMPLVDWLSERAVWDNPYPVGTIYIHSDNPSGADQALMALKRRGYNVKRIALGPNQRS